jgi:hypothetical protein
MTGCIEEVERAVFKVVNCAKGADGEDFPAVRVGKVELDEFAAGEGGFGGADSGMEEVGSVG